MTAVKENGYAIEHADKSLKKDREIIMAALKQDIDIRNYVSKELQDEPELNEIIDAWFENRT